MEGDNGVFIKLYPLIVTLYYRIYASHDAIERWVRLENVGDSGPITLEQAFSANWQLPHRERYRLTYLHGRWGKETQVAEAMTGPGKIVLESRRGAHNLGILSCIGQAWTSDNTDAFDRLRIQEGFSYGYAPGVMMCWVTDCPNFLTKRIVPLSY